MTSLVSRRKVFVSTVLLGPYKTNYLIFVFVFNPGVLNIWVDAVVEEDWLEENICDVAIPVVLLQPSLDLALSQNVRLITRRVNKPILDREHTVLEVRRFRHFE